MKTGNYESTTRLRAVATCVAGTLLQHDLRRATQLLLPLALLAANAGCRHHDLAAGRLEARQAKLHQTAETWAQTEQSRPSRLARTAQHGVWYFQHQAEELDRNLSGAARYLERDLRRWRDRQRVYREKALDLLYGKPERIEPNAIILFY